MIAVVGAGMGGLAAAAWLAKHGRKVTVFEARDRAGGLAASFESEGLRFDAGPYILLDLPGLQWVFHELGEELTNHLSLRRVEEIYQVERDAGPTVRIYGSLDRTAAELEATWPGAGARYAAFVENMSLIYARLQPLQVVSRPGAGELIRAGGWRDIPFLFSSLAAVLQRTGLPREAVDAISIWTHVAGQAGRDAPSPMAFVPAIIHRHGAWVPEGGMGRVPEAFEKIARQAGVEFRLGTKVRRITGDLKIELDGETIPAEAVVSNAGGLATYLDLLEGTPDPFRRELEALPLQTPGVSAYLAVGGPPRSPYLKFRLPPQGLCRLLITPGAVDPSLSGTARLLGPVDYDWSKRAGPRGQEEYLDAVLAEPWWQRDLPDARVVRRRIPSQWGTEYHLCRDAMNPVMTAKFMRRGRLAHRSPVQPGLFLAGSSTHPGQWVSFCAASGILAAKELAC
jgi:phytoene dehydrogenase-like protein